MSIKNMSLCQSCDHLVWYVKDEAASNWTLEQELCLSVASYLLCNGKDVLADRLCADKAITLQLPV